MDKENSHENKNLENLYIDLDSLIVKLSSEKEKYSILNYDTEKINEKITELKSSRNNINNDLKMIKNKEDLLLKSDDSKGKSEKKIVEKKFKSWIKKLMKKEMILVQLKSL